MAASKKVSDCNAYLTVISSLFISFVWQRYGKTAEKSRFF